MRLPKRSSGHRRAAWRLPLLRLGAVLLVAASGLAQQGAADLPTRIAAGTFDPGSVLWYEAPAAAWDAALPVGNGRLGAMVFGGHGEERIQLNEETLWSGGPYSSVVKGGAQVLPRIQRLIFAGEPLAAHKLFGRHLLGRPVEQMKYQCLANLHLFFAAKGEVTAYKRWLDLDTATTGVQYEVDGVRYRREVLASAPDQVITVRLTASEPGRISLRAQLRGVRNTAHSNYGNDYFRMDGVGAGGLMVNGKSADYLGVPGRLRYRVQLQAAAEGGTMRVRDDQLFIDGADAVTLHVAAATNFVDYRDVSGDQVARVTTALRRVAGRSYQEIRSAAIGDHRGYYRRAALELGRTANSILPTDRRLAAFADGADPSLAALAYNFGRYVLIASSRPGTGAANLQGIWNANQNPSWDSKFTMNINAQMNYWPAESANLADCAEPLIALVKELTDQGAQVAREHYGARGWVAHQNTDLWRVAAPMDGPTWGTFTVGGAWLTTQLWEHYLYGLDRSYLEDVYPVLKGSVDFFMDFLVEHPNGRWLVTNPSTSPENPPAGPGYEYFFDEVTGHYYFTTICHGASIDMQILHDLFGYYAEACRILGRDAEYAQRVLAARARLVPPRIGKDGSLQEWTEDYGELQDKHRHFSHMYGLYPGNVLSAKRTPQWVDACKAVLEQRGDQGPGFSRAWKMSLWARLYDGQRAYRVFQGYIRAETCPQLFARCYTALQVDGTLGVTAAITEMLMQSHEGVIDLLPALPAAWSTGRFRGFRARGGFELDAQWAAGRITRVEVRSRKGRPCRIHPKTAVTVTAGGETVPTAAAADGSIAFETRAGVTYTLTPAPRPTRDERAPGRDPGPRRDR